MEDTPHRLDAQSLDPRALFDAMLLALAHPPPLGPGQVWLDHGADISPRRLRAAMASLARGFSVRRRQGGAPRLQICAATEDPHSPPIPDEALRVLGFPVGAPSSLPGRDRRRHQSLWLRSELRATLGPMPALPTLVLGEGEAVDLSAFLARDG